MGRDGRHSIPVINGPDGRPVKMVNLPPRNVKRWVPQRKAEVVAAVHAGLISLEEACSRYALSFEEFMSWEAAFDEHGVSGLSMGEVQHHRHARH